MRTPTRVVALLSVLTACGAASSTSTTTPTRTSAMHEYALIFRPTRAVDPNELPRRNAAAREWALALQREGTLRHAAPLEDDGFVVAAPSVTAVARERAVASVLVIEAKDLESAVALAKGHPGLAFGTEIEVRPVKAVAQSPR